MQQYPGQPMPGQPYGGGPPAGPPMIQAKTSGLAIAGLICGVLALTVGWCCGTGLAFALVGAILSAVAMSQINKNPTTMKGKGIAVTGLILNLIGLVATAVFLAVYVGMNGLQEYQNRLQY